MKLRTHKDVYANVADNLNLEVDLVTLVGNFIWEDLANKLENFEHREIYVYKLGSFRFRRKKSLEYIEKVKNIRIKLTQMGRPPEQIDKAEITVANKINKMKPLLEAWDKLFADKQEFKIRKEKYYADRNIQEPDIDLGRTKEPSIQE